MVKRFFILFALTIALGNINKADVKTLEEINKDIDTIFKVGIFDDGSHKNFYLFVDTLKENHYLFSFVNENNLILDYLLQNQLQVNYDTMQYFVNEKEKLDNYFNSRIHSDSSFCKNVSILIHNYLTNENKVIDSIECSGIADRAVRFYYPIAISGDNKIRTKICVGIHGLKDYGCERDYIKEAFAFSVIFSQLKENNDELYSEYTNTLKEVENMNLSSDNDTRLKRIQGAVWALFSHNTLLRKAIYAEYEKKKSFLPFCIK